MDHTKIKDRFGQCKICKFKKKIEVEKLFLKIRIKSGNLDFSQELVSESASEKKILIQMTITRSWTIKTKISEDKI